MEKKITNIKEDRDQVYEIGYLLVPSIPQEKVETEVASLRSILEKSKVEMIGEEAPELRVLAYTMVKKIGTQNQRFDRGYFGWFKFSLKVNEIESVKKTFEANPHMLRMLLIQTVRENTYLGKKSPLPTPEIPIEPVADVTTSVNSDVVAPVSVDEMDKSIDAMVKEA